MASDFPGLTDQELARQTQAGSPAAFEELVYRYEGRVYGFVARSCGSRADAQEVTQDTFVRAFQAIGQFDLQRSFAPWLFAIARRKCLDRYRAARIWADEPVPDLADEDDPGKLLACREEREGLWDLARRNLPEPQFHALWLKYAEEMNVAEIAQVLSKTQTHVKVLLFRARQALGRELGGVEAVGLLRMAGGPRRAPGQGIARTPYIEGSEGPGARCTIGKAGALVGSKAGAARKGLL